MAFQRGLELGRRLCATILAGAIGAGAVVAQDGAFRGWDEIRDPRFTFNPDRNVLVHFIPDAPTQVRELLTRHADLLKAGSLDAALRMLQQIIDNHGQDVLQVAHSRWVGAAEYARYLIRELPRDAQAVYHDLAELRARSRFTEALRDREEGSLRRIARQFANAAVGQEALLGLARLAHERGHAELAAIHARRALDFLDPSDAVDAAACQRMQTTALALVALAEGRAAVALPADSPPPLTVGGQARPLEEFLADVPEQPFEPPADQWPTYGGNEQHNRLMVEPRVAIDLQQMFELPVTSAGFRGDDNPIPGLLHPPIQPVRMGESLLINNSLSVRSFNLYSKSLEWEFEGPMLAGLDNYFEVGEYAVGMRWDRDENPVSKGLITGLTVAQGVVLANLQVPEEKHQVDRIGHRIVINDLYPTRGLFALSQGDGSLLWSQGGRIENDRLRGHRTFQPAELPGDRDGLVARLTIPGPTAVVDDRVFALGHFIEGAVNSYLVALDLKTGSVEYSVSLVSGQQELSMFNMPFQEFTTGIPVVGDGMVFCPTNLGLVAAVDITFGDLRWLSAYDSIPIIPPPSYYQNSPRPVYWYNSPPVVQDGVLLVTPHDSQSIVALDTATGMLRWDHPVQVRYSSARRKAFFLGVQGPQAVVLYDGEVRGLDVQTGKVRWEEDLTGLDILGRGCLTADSVYIPTENALVVLGSAGTAKGYYRWPDAGEDAWNSRRESRMFDSAILAGNVLVFPDMVVSANRDRVSVGFDPDSLLLDLEARVLRDGESFSVLARIASLYRRRGELARAADTFERALRETTAGPRSQAEVARVRFSLCHVWYDLAMKQALVDDLAAARESLVRAFEYVSDLDTQLMVTRALLTELRPAPDDPLAVEWLEQLRDRYGSERALFPEWSTTELSVGTYACLELARRHRAADEPARALAELQRLHLDYATDTFDGKTATEFARVQIEEILRGSSPELREAFDRQALAQFEEAVANRDVHRLGLLLRQYPNAADVRRFSAVYCNLLREEGRLAEVIEAGSALLRHEQGDESSRIALTEMAWAAYGLRNPSLGDGLLRRLETEGGGGELPAELRAERDRPRPADPAAREPEGPPELEGTIGIARNSALLGSDSELKGEPLPTDLGGCLVLSDDGNLSLLSARGEELWRAPLNLTTRLWMARYAHVAGALIVRHSSQLLAIDLRDGSLLWEQAYDRNLVQFEGCAGLLLVVEERASPGGDDEATSLSLSALEPRTGALIWERPLQGTNMPFPIVCQGDVAALVTDLQPSMIEVFEVISGRRLLQPAPSIALSTVVQPHVLSDRGLIVLPERDAQGSDMMQARISVDRLAAYRLASGELAWAVDLHSFDSTLKSVHDLGRDLALEVGGASRRQVLVVDADTGKLRRDQKLSSRFAVETPSGSTSAPSLLFCFESGTIMVKKDALYLGLAEDGSLAWEANVQLPAGTQRMSAPNRIFRRGDQLLVVIQDRHAVGRERFTDLITLDARDGEVLDIQPFSRTSRSGSAADAQEFLGAERLYLLIGETLYVLRW